MDNLIGKVLWGNPIIFYAWMYMGRENTIFDEFLENLAQKDAVFLMWIAWSKEARHEGHNEATNKIRKWLEARQENRPHKFIFIANTILERFHLRKAGISCELFNQNAFIDPDLYIPSGQPKSFDCVYNGQFIDFKRHELLQKTSSCLLISYKAEKEYFFKHISPRLGSQFTVANPIDFTDADEIKLKVLNSSQVIENINKAKVGICLSKCEGAMHAAVEYLLCGLPVLTTSSEGGRDFLFDGRYVFCAPDDPYVIAEGVKALADMELSSNFIRSETIRKQRAIIKEFCRFIDHLVRESRSIDINSFSIWDHIYCNKLHETKSISLHIGDIDKLQALEAQARIDWY